MFWLPRSTGAARWQRPAGALLATSMLLVAPSCQRPVPAPSEAGRRPHWGYSGRAGPRRWASLGPENGACGRGREQSPVDVGGARPGAVPPMVLQYRPVTVAASDTGHTIEWTFGTGSSAVIDGVEYALLQAHFHAPAEHLVGGRRELVEIHLVHQAADGRRAVLAVLARRGRPHPGMARLLEALPGRRERGSGTPLSLSPLALLPAGAAAVRYQGSLTTPPCAENVRWVVMTQPIELSPGQLDILRARYSGNSRPEQPLNGRRPVAATVALSG